MSNRAVGSLHDQLELTINYHVMEFDLSCAEVIGALELIKANCIRQMQDGGMIDDDDDEEFDDDTDLEDE